MAKSCFTVLCFFIVGFVRGITVEERLSELERVIFLQSETLSQHESLIREQRDKLETFQNENDILKTRVEFLEDAIEQLHRVGDDDAVTSNKPDTEDDQQAVSADIRESRDSSIQRYNHRINLQDKPQRRLALPLVSKNVAFHAHSLANRCLHDNDVLVFAVKDLDVGDGYNKRTGVYVVPVTGTYVFTWTAIMTDYYYAAQIMVNGQPRGRATADSYGGDMLVQATGLVVTEVVAGDQVFIKRSEGSDCHVHAYDALDTSFAGWLLF